MSLEIDLKGKVAVVTGVSQGLGLGVAKVLANAGCNIAGCAFSSKESDKAQNFLEIMKLENIKANYFSVDVTKLEEQSRFIDSVIKEFGRIDLVISNAGVNVFKGVLDCSEEDWSYNEQLNLSSHWRLAKLTYLYLSKNADGVFIVMTSNHCNSTMSGCFPYNVTKTALKGLVQSMAIEWGPLIRTIGIAPGFIQSPANKQWFDAYDEPKDEEKKTIDLHPVGRLGTVEDVGALCAFLASGYAGFISGTTYLIDGGRSALMQD
ncbi:MAG: SDR family oxidoreductase [Spirochaetaceae bacterium]